MKYKLVKSSKRDIDKLIRYKKQTIFEYAKELPTKEVEIINNYVNKNVSATLDDYQNIVVDNNIIGCLLITKKDNGVLLDEIYLEEEYRNNGIGTDIINKTKKDNNIIYLWVYKMNKKAIALYKRLGFNIVEETETRYYMKYER